MRMPDTHERLAAAIYEGRHRSFGLILDDAEVGAVCFNRPRLDFSKTVAGGETHGILDSRIIPNLDARVIPPVKTVANVAAVVERNFLFENSGMWPEHEFH